MTQHTYITPETHNCNPDDYCAVCDGGPSVCKVCCGMEGSMPSECPGEPMTLDQSTSVYQGLLDFRNGEWVKKISVHSPEHYRIFQRAIREAGEKA